MRTTKMNQFTKSQNIKKWERTGKNVAGLILKFQKYGNYFLAPNP
jgi:hypothetical protein